MAWTQATFEREDGEEIFVEADVRFTPASGEYGPPEDYSPGDVDFVDFRATDVEGNEVELTDAEYEKATDLLMDNAEDDD